MHINKQNLIQIFCINHGREVLVSDKFKLSNGKIPDLTICASGINEALEKITDEWNILCNADHLIKAYSIKFDNFNRDIYLLKMDLTSKMEEVVIEKGTWKFVDYPTLLNNWHYSKDNHSFKAIASLSAWLG